MKPKDHAVLLYTNRDDRNDVFFTYLRTGLRNGEAAVYVTCQQPVEKVEKDLNRFGIDVRENEKNGSLRVLTFDEVYLPEGKFDSPGLTKRWREMTDYTLKSFKGIRVTAEAARFFEVGLVKELLDYEQSLHRTLEFPASAICGYDVDVIARECGINGVKVLLDIIKVHSTAIVMGLDKVLLRVEPN